MISNVGGFDKIARIVIGAGLIGATVAGLLPVWGYVGVVPLLTGLISWCPVYPLMGINTCQTKK